MFVSCSVYGLECEKVCASLWSRVALEGASLQALASVINGLIMDVVVMEECADVPFNDEEALSEVLEPEEQEQEQEGSKRQ